MKLLLAQTSAFAILLLFTLTVKAQDNDYIINNHGDTIKCIIKTPTFGHPKFQPVNAPHDEYAAITIDNIKEYYRAETHITFRRIYKDSTGVGSAVSYMRLLEKGTISIYLEETSSSYYSGRNTTFGSTSEQWYVTKNSDTGTLVKTSNLGVIKTSSGERKNVLAEFLKDKKDVYDKFVKDNKFGSKDIRRIVRLYNTGVEIKQH